MITRVYVDGKLMFEGKGPFSLGQWFKELGTGKIRHIAVTTDD